MDIKITASNPEGRALDVQLLHQMAQGRKKQPDYRSDCKIQPQHALCNFQSLHDISRASLDGMETRSQTNKKKRDSLHESDGFQNPETNTHSPPSQRIPLGQQTPPNQQNDKIEKSFKDEWMAHAVERLDRWGGRKSICSPFMDIRTDKLTPESYGDFIRRGRQASGDSSKITPPRAYQQVVENNEHHQASEDNDNHGAFVVTPPRAPSTGVTPTASPSSANQGSFTSTNEKTIPTIFPKERYRIKDEFWNDKPAESERFPFERDDLLGIHSNFNPERDMETVPAYVMLPRGWRQLRSRKIERRYLIHAPREENKENSGNGEKPSAHS